MINSAHCAASLCGDFARLSHENGAMRCAYCALRSSWLLDRPLKRALKSDSKKRRCVARARSRAGAPVFWRGLRKSGAACGLPFRRGPRSCGRLHFGYLRITRAYIGGIGHLHVSFLVGHRKMRRNQLRNAVVLLGGGKPHVHVSCLPLIPIERTTAFRNSFRLILRCPTRKLT